MNAGLAANPVPNVRRTAEPDVKSEMKAHRERLKQAVHPGRTQKEAGFTDAERARLVGGVCEGLAGATERGERLANRILALLAVVLLLALGFGAVQGRWAEKQAVQTVEAQ